MTKIPNLTLVLLLALVNLSFGQSKMLVGKKHTILVDIPKNWVQAPNAQLPLFLKPDRKEVDEKTYSYVYGLDYDMNPDLDGWIEGNTNNLKETNKGLKVGSLDLQFKNLRKNDYLTGRYKTITYEYEDHRKEVLLIVECKNTIVTCVLSTANENDFKVFLPALIYLGRSLRVIGTSMKPEQEIHSQTTNSSSIKSVMKNDHDKSGQVSVSHQIQLLPPPPPTSSRLASDFPSIRDWLLSVCSTDKPKVPIDTYTFGLFESPEGYTLALTGENTRKEEESHLVTSIDFKPTVAYYKLPDAEYKGLARAEVLSKLAKELQEFFKTEAFKNSFFSQANAIRLSSNGQVVWARGQ